MDDSQEPIAKRKAGYGAGSAGAGCCGIWVGLEAVLHGMIVRVS